MIKDLRLVKATKFYRKEGILFAHIEDHSYESENGDSTDIEVLIPPGLTIDYDTEQEVSIQGWYGTWAGKRYFMIDLFCTCPLENINGTILYHIQDSTVNIQLSKNKIHIQATEGTEIILEKDQPMSIKANGLSLYDVLSDLVTEVKDLQTFGPPPNHKVSPDSITKLELLQVEKIDKLLR